MTIEIKSRNLEQEVRQALQLGFADDEHVLWEIARRHPDTTFFRLDVNKKTHDVKRVEYTSSEMRLAVERGISVR